MIPDKPEELMPKLQPKRQIRGPDAAGGKGVGANKHDADWAKQNHAGISGESQENKDVRRWKEKNPEKIAEATKEPTQEELNSPDFESMLYRTIAEIKKVLPPEDQDPQDHKLLNELMEQARQYLAKGNQEGFMEIYNKILDLYKFQPV